jgi:Ca2+-binding RTX toxin-like protein
MGVQVGGPTAAVAGQQRAYSFTVFGTDGLPYNGTYSLQINWGDGEPLTNFTNNTFNRPTVSLSHTFPFFGTFPVSVQVSNSSGQGGSGGGSVAVTPALVEGGTLYVGGDRSNGWMVVAPAGDTGGVQVTHNTLQFGPFFPTDRIIVFGGEGMDEIFVNTTTVGGQTYAVTLPVIVFGGFHDDRIDATGAGGPVALIGGGGRDTLYGGAGDDILVGGTVTDTLFGGGGSDILIGGSTSYDLDPAAYVALLAEWGRAAEPLQVRYDRLRGMRSDGLNVGYYLWFSTVHNDSAVDNLWGQGGIDWFFTHPSSTGVDQRRDYVDGEFYTFI